MNQCTLVLQIWTKFLQEAAVFRWEEKIFNHFAYISFNGKKQQNSIICTSNAWN